MNASEFLTYLGTDGQKWAQEFCKRFAGKEIEVDDLFTWFANAIEVGRAAGARTVRRQQIEERLSEPSIHFNGAQLTIDGLGKILKILDDKGEVTVKGIAEGSANGFFSGLLIGNFFGRDRAVTNALIGRTANERVRAELELRPGIGRSGVMCRTKYQHKLLRHPVYVDDSHPFPRWQP